MSMDAPRERTWDLVLGLDLLRWGDSLDMIQGLYPDSRRLRERTGVNPLTKAPFWLGPGVLVPHGRFSLPIDFLGFEISLSAYAGENGLSKISLLSVQVDDRYKDVSWRAWVASLLQLVSSLGAGFKFGPIDPDKMEQSWRRSPVEVALFLEHKGFGLTFTHSEHAPASTGV